MQTTPPDVVAEDAGVVTDPRRQRRILIAMITSLVAVIAAVSGLNVAQQDLAMELGASQSQLLWIINGYTMALAALLLPIGAIGDRWGRKHVLLVGLAVFAVANLLSAFATTPELLIISRIIAGVGAAAIMPVTLSVITSSFPGEERARAVGIWAGFAGAGGILGIFVSSLLIDYFTWPWLFAMPIAFASIGTIMTVTSVANSREDHEGRFDVVGSVLSAVAIGGLVLGIHEGPEVGWTSGLALGGLIVGVAAAVGFVIYELRHERPLLDVRAFSDRRLAAGSITLLIVFGVMFGIFLVMMQFLQAVLGYSALKAAAGLLPMVVVMMPLSAVAPVIAKRVGTGRMLLTGTVVFGSGLALLALLISADGGYLSILPGFVLVAVGMGLMMSPATTAITSSLPPEKQGVASALNDTVRELGGAIGIALLGSLVSAGYRSNVSDATASLAPGLAHQVEEGIGTAYAAAPQLGADAPRVLEAAQQAFVEGWQGAMWIGVGLAAVAVVYLVVWGPKGRDAEDIAAYEGDEAIDTAPLEADPVPAG